MMKNKCALLGMLLMAGTAGAEDQVHDGFFLNLGLGIGTTSMHYTLNDYNYALDDYSEFYGDLSGISTLLDIRIGVCPIDNLAISFDLSGITMDEPKVESHYFSGTAKGSYNISAMGLGGTWFIEEWNAYAGGSFFFLGQENLENDVVSGRVEGSLKGIALRLGREVWISDNWGLGAQFQYSWMNFEADVANEETDDFSTVGLLLSATFN